jgi:hypothetical protein
MKKSILSTSILLAVCAIGSNAQTSSYTLNSSGGSANLSGNTYEWNIGEMVLVNTASGSGIVVTQGLLQPNKSEVGINTPKLDDHSLTVYPNPTESNVFIKPSLAPNTEIGFNLYDITGRLFEQKKVVLKQGNEIQTLDFRPYAAGVYMLEVLTTMDGQQYRNGFKIQNNKF